MRKTLVLGSIAALGFAGSAFAQDGFSYSNVDLNYVRTDMELDDLEDDADGFQLRGSLAFTDMFHGFASYSNQELNDFDVDLINWEVGVGANHSISPNLDVIGRVGFVKTELDGDGGDVDEDGFSLEAALRGKVAEQFELEGGIHYVDLGEAFDADTSFRGTARYFFTDALAGQAGVSLNDDDTVWFLGARFNFAGPK